MFLVRAVTRDPGGASGKRRERKAEGRRERKKGAGRKKKKHGFEVSCGEKEERKKTEKNIEIGLLGLNTEDRREGGHPR